jgi:hypothetical protein
LRPEIAAGIVTATHTASANEEALRHLPAAIRQDPVLYPLLYPPPEVLARGEWFEAQPAASQKLRDRLWTEIKNS